MAPGEVRTARGRVRAPFVVVAGNGYLGGLVPEVAARVMPINNFIVATAPLGEARARALIQGDVAVADSRFVVNYFRLSADGRLLFGGGESYGWRFPADIAGLVRPRMLAVFPGLADVAIEHAWGGTLAITVNRMPAFQRLGAGGLLGRRLFRARGGAGDAGGEADGRGGAGDGREVRRARRAAAAALSRRGGAALAAPRAGDDLVRDAGPALMPLWVAISLAAAFLQNLRTALQKALTPRVGVIGATYARFLFAAPWAVLLVAVLVLGEGAHLPEPTAGFVVWGLVGAVAQIGATLLLLHLFRLRNFAVGNTFAKTETVQAVLFGFLLLGDRVGALALAGMLVSLAGLVMLSATRGFGGGALNRAVLGKVFSQDTEDEVFSTLYFPEGVTGQVSVNWSDESYRKMTTRITIWGTQGRIHADRQECQVYIRENAGKDPEGYEPGWNVRYTTELTKRCGSTCAARNTARSSTTLYAGCQIATWKARTRSAVPR